VSKCDLNPLEDMNEILGHLIMKCHNQICDKKDTEILGMRD